MASHEELVRAYVQVTVDYLEGRFSYPEDKTNVAVLKRYQAAADAAQEVQDVLIELLYITVRCSRRDPVKELEFLSRIESKIHREGRID